jgi:hypothetical protein
MEVIDNNLMPVIVHPNTTSLEQHVPEGSSNSFIEANTTAVNTNEMRDRHIIPVFVKDNEPLISHSDFIDAVYSLTREMYADEQILPPVVRVSHPVKGRIPEAKDKSADQLFEWEKTLYYERMMFVIEIPSYQVEIDGNILSLTIGGVKSYNTDNLYSRNMGDQHFKLFAGFKNKVCTNLCIWTDGLKSDVRVSSIGGLHVAISTLLKNYNAGFQLSHLRRLTEHSITEQQFAHLVGKCRMYNHLPLDVKKGIPPVLLTDQQVSTVVKDFYRDESFCRDSNGNINLWRLYNLFTGANKSSYIDSFLSRSVNAYNLVEQIRWSLEGKNECWYLD